MVKVVYEQIEGAQAMIITASYTDDGSVISLPLTTEVSRTLRSSHMGFSENTTQNGMMAVKFGGMDLLLLPPESCWFLLEDIDLTGISMAAIMVGWQDLPTSSIDFEMRLNSPEGPVLGSGRMPKPGKGQMGGMVPIKMSQILTEKAEALYFVHKPAEGEDRGPNPVALTGIQFM